MRTIQVTLDGRQVAAFQVSNRIGQANVRAKALVAFAVLRRQHERHIPPAMLEKFWPQVVAQVCALVDVDPARVFLHQRIRPFVTARQLIAAAWREATLEPYTQIGKRMEGRDHSTVMNMIDAINDFATHYSSERALLVEANRIAQSIVGPHVEPTYDELAEEVAELRRRLAELSAAVIENVTN